MKRSILLVMVLWAETGFSQGHISPCNGTSDHSTGICYGYAMGRAAGRAAGDPACDPLTFHRTSIDPNFFEFHSDGSLTGLQPGDIVRFADHAAYVVTPSTTVNNIVVDQVPYEGGQEQTGILLGTQPLSTSPCPEMAMSRLSSKTCWAEKL